MKRHGYIELADVRLKVLKMKQKSKNTLKNKNRSFQNPFTLSKSCYAE